MTRLKIKSYNAILTEKQQKLSSTHYFLMKILSKRELQQIVFNHSSDINFRDL